MGTNKKRNGLLLVKHTHKQNIRPFTHKLMLAMERADKDRNKLLLLKHTHIHNTRPCIQ